MNLKQRQIRANAISPGPIPTPGYDQFRFTPAQMDCHGTFLASQHFQKVLSVLDSEGLRAELGARGRKRIEDTLNWEHEKRELLAAYKKALSR